jgi:DNA-binding GntR family transcriptional regulator
VQNLSELLRASIWTRSLAPAQAGVSRQRVNQALQVLEKAGLLKVEFGRLRILDLDSSF